jgi:MFS transporter, ACS family, D-galactonate transporter
MGAAVETGASPPQPSRAWLIVVLLFFFMFINYADKAVLGLAQPQIMHDLQLTNTQFGFVGSSFFFLFSLSSVVFGFSANRWPSRWLLLGMGLAWAATQFPMVGAAGFGTLVTCRILLGASEGPGYPVALHAAYKWFPNDRRTLPTNILAIGAGIGAASAGQILPYIIVTWSWHFAFLAVGLAGLAWALAWFLLGREGPLEDHTLDGAPSGGIPYRHLLLNRTALGVFLICFTSYWGIAVALVWGTGYMIKIVQLTQVEAGRIQTLPTLLTIVLGPMIAITSQRLVQRGVPSRLARGAFGSAGVILGGVGIAAMALVPDPTAKIVCFTLAASIMYVIFTVGPPIIAEITPPRQRAAMLAINNAGYSLAGVAAPYIMGRVLDVAPGDLATGYRDGYLLLAGLLVLSGVAGFFMIDPARDAARLAGLNEDAVPTLSPAE